MLSVPRKSGVFFARFKLAATAVCCSVYLIESECYGEDRKKSKKKEGTSKVHMVRKKRKQFRQRRHKNN